MYGLLFLLFHSVCLSLASQLENLKNKHGIVNIEPPRLDFPSEALKLFGGFDALTFPQYEGQENFTGTINNNTDSRGIVYYSNDTFIKLINGSSDSYVEKIVPFGSESFILGGSGSLLGYELGRQLLYNLSDLSLRPIFGNPLTDVRVILEDYPVAYFGAISPLITDRLLDTASRPGIVQVILPRFFRSRALAKDPSSIPLSNWTLITFCSRVNFIH